MSWEKLVEIRQCSAAAQCLASIDLAGPERARCRLCLYSGHGSVRFWKPVDGRSPHPEDRQRKEEERRRRRLEAAERRRQRDLSRRRTAGRAAAAERKAAEAGGWKASLHSGRIFGDADLKTQFGDVRVFLDHKQQSGNGWTVSKSDLDRVRADAARTNAVGGLVLCSRSGRRVVVFDLDDWKRLERHASLASL